MFTKPTTMSNEKTNGSSGATLISAGTTLKGDISSNQRSPDRWNNYWQRKQHR